MEGRTNPLNHPLGNIVWVWFRMFLKFKLRLVWCFALQSYSTPSPFVAPLSSEVGSRAMCCICAFTIAAKQINLFQRCNMEDYCIFYFYGHDFALFHTQTLSLIWPWVLSNCLCTGDIMWCFPLLLLQTRAICQSNISYEQIWTDLQPWQHSCFMVPFIWRSEHRLPTFSLREWK